MTCCRDGGLGGAEIIGGKVLLFRVNIDAAAAFKIKVRLKLGEGTKVLEASRDYVRMERKELCLWRPNWKCLRGFLYKQFRVDSKREDKENDKYSTDEVLTKFSWRAMV